MDRRKTHERVHSANDQAQFKQTHARSERISDSAQDGHADSLEPLGTETVNECSQILHTPMPEKGKYPVPVKDSR